MDVMKTLGITREDLLERIIEKCVDHILDPYEDPDDPTVFDQFSDKLHGLVKERIDAKIEHVGSTEIIPRVEQYIDNAVLQETDRWGEAKGEPKSFKDYLADCAENYLMQKVDWKGNVVSGYGAKDAQTRLTHLIHNHLHDEIATAMKNVASKFNKIFAEAMMETAKLKLNEIANTLQISIKHR